MHTFTSARRPKIVYGRIRGMQQHRRARAESSSASSDSDGRRGDGEVADSDDENDYRNAKENVPATVKPTAAMPVLTKTKAISSTTAPKRKPLQQKHNGSTSSDDVVTIDSTSDESATDAIRSPVQRRKGKGTECRPVVIRSSSSEASSSSSSSSSYASAEEDASLSQQQTREAANVDSLSKQLGRMLSVSQQRGNKSITSLLDACEQKHALAFDACLDDMEQQASSSQWKKIGEATYSEVYSMEDSGMVLKVIPLLEEDGDASPGNDSSSTSGPQLERSNPGDVMREVNMTRSLSKTDETFVRLHRAAVVRGAYPARLLRAWDARRRAETDQNVRPDTFDGGQLYGLLLLSDGGQDLETAALSNWSQAASLFCQVTNALAHAESACEFEHRDLHWGNVVVKQIDAPRQARRRRGKSGSGTPVLDVERISSANRSGVQATIIDFTLSRARLPGAQGSGSEVTAHPFDDEAFFSGSGDIQFDVYRQMRACTQDDWHAFHPRTNVLWLRYLLTKIIEDKGLSEPASSRHDDVERTCFTLLSAMRVALQGDSDDENDDANMPDAATVSLLLATTLSDVMTAYPAK